MALGTESVEWVYCPRCDRRYANMELMTEHLENHSDYDSEEY